MARKHAFLICLCICLLPFAKSDNETHSEEGRSSYQDEWVIRVEGGSAVSSLLALQSGYKNLGLCSPNIPEISSWNICHCSLWSESVTSTNECISMTYDDVVWVRVDVTGTWTTFSFNVSTQSPLAREIRLLTLAQRSTAPPRRVSEVGAHIPAGGQSAVISGRVLGFKDTYLWRKDDQPRQRKRWGLRFVKALTSHPEILWADQQRIFERHKRDYVIMDLPDSEKPLVREKRLLDERKPAQDLLTGRKWDQGMDQDPGTSGMFNDELWNEEWYLQDTRTNKELPKLDLNVLPLYRRGITGRGVRIAVLDDGLEHTHEDLRTNYDPEISYDVNNADDDPIPRYESTGMNGHGTRCAGEIAMEANNGKCGVGVAFESRVGGIKLLDGIVNDRVEGEALGYKQDLVDIYTASWGPADDGKSLESPGRLASEALRRGITEGRNGKGSIYVWASGNGGSKHDDCGCDGYVGSIYTIAVGSASQTGKFPWYGERCPATLATTYSSGAYHDQMIATTDLRNKCTTRHTGTSASAPLAAGIFALALQMNKELTWRDVQHLVVQTSEYSPLRNNPGWFKNSAGFWFNSRFGFGLMNAHTLVMAAQNWTKVPEGKVCRIKPSAINDRRLVYGKTRIVRFEVDECHVEDEGRVFFLEHVQIETSIKYTRRGALRMHLTSPSGTEIEILNPRQLDKSMEGFTEWKFMSVATWGEDPRGTWSLEIADRVGPETNNGTIEDLTLIIHGTEELPRYRENGARIYNDEYNRIRKMNRPESPDYLDHESWKKSDDNEMNFSRETQKLDGIFGTTWLARLLGS